MFALFAMCACAAPQRPIMVLDLQQPPPMPDLLAIQVCCGLLNRARSNTTSCYTISSPNDIEWLAVIAPSLPSPPPFTPIPTFLRACFAAAASHTVIAFNYTQQQELVPNIITVASVLSAVPLPPSSPYAPPSPRYLFNASAVWPPGNHTPNIHTDFPHQTIFPRNQSAASNTIRVRSLGKCHERARDDESRL